MPCCLSVPVADNLFPIKYCFQLKADSLPTSFVPVCRGRTATVPISWSTAWWRSISCCSSSASPASTACPPTPPLSSGGASSSYVRGPTRAPFSGALGLVLRIRIRIWNPDPNTGEQKMTHKSREKFKLYVLKCWMFSFEGWRLLL